MDEDDFDLGGFDEAYSESDFGENQAFSDSDRASLFGGGDFVDTGLGDDISYGDTVRSILGGSNIGTNRTNITNVGSGSNLTYDPLFAAALDISRGLDPTNNMGGTGGLAVPSSLRPQVPGNLVLNEAGDRMMYGSGLERFAQETLPPMIQSAQKLGIGGLLDSIMGTFTDAKNALGKMGDAVGGISLPDLFISANPMPNMSNEQTNMGTLDPSDRFLGDMSQRDAFIPTAGITNIRPDLSREANISVADATNQPFFEEGPPTPIDSGPGIQIVPGSGQNRFQFATSTGSPLPGAFPMGNVSDILNFSDLERETKRLSPYEQEFLAGRRDGIMGVVPTFITREDLIRRQQI